MRILLLSMPDTAQFVDFITRLPNLAIISLAGNLPGHEVRVLDLILFKPHFEAALRQALSSLRPQVVGLSAMTFQFDTLLRVARLIRAFDPTIKLVAGGYHVSLMARELTADAEELPLDFLVRLEGEATFRELVTELEKPAPDLRRHPGPQLSPGPGVGPQSQAPAAGAGYPALAPAPGQTGQRLLFFRDAHGRGRNLQRLPE